MNILALFISFFKIGLFSIGGGLATLPFLYELSEQTQWYSTEEIANMIAISESTPGPLGVNMATYVGFITAGIAGSIIAPVGLVFPSIIIIILISKILDQFKSSIYVQRVFHLLRAASAALIVTACINICKIAFLQNGDNLLSCINYKNILLAIVLYVALIKWKKHPVCYIAASAIIGILFQLH